MNQKGFSLCELQICCAMITILMAIAYPRMGDVLQSLALRDEINVLYGNLQRAKIEAIKENTFVVFQVKSDGYTIFVDNGAGGGKRGDWVKQPGERGIIDHRYQKGISLVKTTLGAKRTRFHGRPGVSAGRVILKNTKGSKTQLVINIAGRFRVEKL